MKSNVRITALSWLLCLATMLSLVPGITLSVQAATTWSSDQTLRSSNTYNSEIIVTKSITLTLDSCDVTANGGIYIQSGTLTITGTGKLYVQGLRASTNTMGHGIKGDVIVNGAGLEVNAADCGYGIQDNLEVIGEDIWVEVNGGYGGEPQPSGQGSGGGMGISGNVTVDGGILYVVGGDGGKGYSSTNPNAACYGAITAAVRKESSTGGAWNDISGDTSALQYVRIDGHAHHFNYTANGATITATCDAEDCRLPNRTAAITINAPTGILMADGSRKAATISGSIPEVAMPAITYTKDGTAVDASEVKEAGNYVASITLGDAVASVAFTIIPTTYIITIPAKLDVKNPGYNATDGLSASGTILADKKVVVTASSANAWALKSGSNAISYYLTDAEDGAKTTQWTFYEDELAETTTRPLGAVVEDYSRKPSGEYADIVTFTARMESIYTTRQVWNGDQLYNAAGSGATTFTKDGITFEFGSVTRGTGGGFEQVTFSGGGTFTTDTGKITRIEIYSRNSVGTPNSMIGRKGWVRTDYEYYNDNDMEYWVAWAGTPATSVDFDNGFTMSDSILDYIKVTLADR